MEPDDDDTDEMRREHLQAELDEIAGEERAERARDWADGPWWI